MTNSTTKRHGDWMQTYTGRAFYPLDSRPEDIDPLDIAHALSLICRFGGHIKRFYSVAEHCLLMSGAVPEEYALWALLHDATEAYVGDMVRPLKRNMPAYRDAEDRIMRSVATRFGLASATMPDQVKYADSRILLDERAELLGPSPQLWNPYLESLEPLGVFVAGYESRIIERAYLNRLTELTR